MAESVPSTSNGAPFPEQVRWLRQRATELRKIADGLNNQADQLERRLSDRPLIGGRALADVAVVVLAFEGNGGMHYRDILARVEATSSKRVRGADPAATLLATIGRDPRIVNCGSRSGLYTLAEGGSDAAS